MAKERLSMREIRVLGHVLVLCAWANDIRMSALRRHVKEQ